MACEIHGVQDGITADIRVHNQRLNGERCRRMGRVSLATAILAIGMESATRLPPR